MDLENQLVPISLDKSARQPGTPGVAQTSDGVIREWIGRFAENCGQVPSEGRVLLWIDELGSIEPSLLEQAFRTVLQTHAVNTIPQIGEIRAQLEQSKTCAAA